MVEPGKKPVRFALRVEDRLPLSVAVSRQLREAIVSGKVSVGDELPSEKELGEQLKVGRSTVREALRILQAQGLVSGGDTVSTQRPRVSRDSTLSTAAQAIENVVRLGQIPLDDLVELRVVIEGAAVESAADEPDDAALIAAREALETMQRPKLDVETFRAADILFHQSLAAASGNAAFPLVMGVLRSAISAHLGEALDKVPHVQKTMAALTREHAAILEAVARAHRKLARTLVTEHIRGFYAGRRAP